MPGVRVAIPVVVVVVVVVARRSVVRAASVGGVSAASGMRSWRTLIPILAVLVLTIWLVARGCARSEDVPRETPAVVAVPDRVAVRDRPRPAPPKFIERIVTRPVVVVREVSVGTPDTLRARAYARKVFEAESLRAVIRRLRAAGDDSTVVAMPAPILPPVSGRYDGRRLTLWLTQSNGAVMRATARVKPRWSFVAGHGGLSDTLPLVRGDRWWVRQVREVPGCLPATALGAGGGALVADDALAGAAFGGLALLVACLSD